MTDEEKVKFDLLLELSKQIQDGQREARADMREQRQRLASIERELLHVVREQAEQRAEFHNRFDRLMDRLERIEQRLGLVDSGPAGGGAPPPVPQPPPH